MEDVLLKNKQLISWHVLICTQNHLVSVPEGAAWVPASSLSLMGVVEHTNNQGNQYHCHSLDTYTGPKGVVKQGYIK